MRRLPILVFCLLSVSYSCSETRKAKEKDILASTAKEDFKSFYTRFHTDTVFQIERVRFPLAGKAVEFGNERPWKKEEWHYHKVKTTDLDTNEYQTELRQTDSLVVDKVWIPNSGFYLERQFELNRGKWYLTYYLDENI